MFFITTANNLHGIPVPLQDRMEIIQLNGYTEEEKLNIATGFLLPKQLEANGFKAMISPSATRPFLRSSGATPERPGCVTLSGTLPASAARLPVTGLKNKEPRQEIPHILSSGHQAYLGVPKYRFGLAEERDEIGLTTGMAWTEVGGELLQIEATLMPGSGKLTITGKLGDVMQESAQAALSYVRSRALRLGLDTDFYQKTRYSCSCAGRGDPQGWAVCRYYHCHLHCLGPSQASG